jgi:hypothetical protein
MHGRGIDKQDARIFTKRPTTQALDVRLTRPAFRLATPKAMV